jgi:hypothetical protein
LEIVMSRLLLSSALTFALATAGWAAPVPATPKIESLATKARAALDQKITAKADQKTLNETIDMFKEYTKVDIVLDVGAIQMVGMSPDQQIVKFDVKDVPVREALKAAFGKFNLRCGITSSGLLVSTDEGLIVRQLRQRVSVDAEGKALPDLLKGLASDTGVNVVLDPRAAKKAADASVTLKLDDVPVETAVRLISEVASFRVVRMSNVLFVTTDDRVEKLKDDADRPAPPAPVQPVFPTDPGIPFPLPGIAPPIQVAPGGVGGVEVVPPVVERVQPEKPVEKR